MLVAAGEKVGVRLEEDTELTSLHSDIQLQLFPYVTAEWAKCFPRVFPGLTANRLVVVTPRTPEPAPSRASPAGSATNVRDFPDLDLSRVCVDVELAVLPTQVQQRVPLLEESDEAMASPTLSAVPPPSTQPSDHSAGSRTASSAPSPSALSIHPA